MGQLASQKVTTVYPVADHFVLLSVTGCFFLFLGKGRSEVTPEWVDNNTHVISHKMENKTFDGAAGILNHPSGNVHHAG